MQQSQKTPKKVVKNGEIEWGKQKLEISSNVSKQTIMKIFADSVFEYNKRYCELVKQDPSEYGYSEQEANEMIPKTINFGDVERTTIRVWYGKTKNEDYIFGLAIKFNPELDSLSKKPNPSSYPLHSFCLNLSTVEWKVSSSSQVDLNDRGMKFAISGQDARTIIKLLVDSCSQKNNEIYELIKNLQ